MVIEELINNGANVNAANYRGLVSEVIVVIKAASKSLYNAYCIQFSTYYCSSIKWNLW